MTTKMDLLPRLIGYREPSFSILQERGQIIVFICVVAVCCACDMLLPPQAGLEIAGLLYGSWSIWLGVSEARTATLRCNPLVTYQLWQAATLGFSPLYLALSYSEDNPVPFARTVVTVQQIAYGHAILVVGAFALYLGMKQFGPKERPARNRVGREVSLSELSICFGAGAMIQIFTPEITPLMGSAIAVLSTMALASLSIFSIKPPVRLRRSGGVYWGVLLAGTIALLVLNASGDSKMMLSFSFVPLALAIQRRKGIGSLIVFGIGFIAIYLILIAPLVGEMRNRVRLDERGQRSVMDSSAFGDAASSLNAEFRNDSTGYMNAWFDTTMLRLSDSVPAGLIADFVATDGLLHGAGMEYVPMTFIPRLLWHNKPIIERGRYFTTALGMASAESTATTSTGQTAAGELFWNFGWPGVVIGMYLLGAAFSAWWRADGGSPTNGVLEMTAFIGCTLSFVLGAGSAAGTMFIGALAGAIVLGVLIRVRDWMFPRRGRYRRNAVRAAPAGARCR